MQAGRKRQNGMRAGPHPRHHRPNSTTPRSEASFGIGGEAAWCKLLVEMGAAVLPASRRSPVIQEVMSEAERAAHAFHRSDSHSVRRVP